MMMGARDVSPRGGGLIHHIDGAATAEALRNRPGGLVDVLVGNVGRQQARLYLQWLRRFGRRRRRTFMVVIELFCLCEIFACCVRYLTDGRNTRQVSYTCAHRIFDPPEGRIRWTKRGREGGEEKRGEKKGREEEGLWLCAVASVLHLKH